MSSRRSKRSALPSSEPASDPESKKSLMQEGESSTSILSQDTSTLQGSSASEFSLSNVSTATSSRDFHFVRSSQSLTPVEISVSSESFSVPIVSGLTTESGEGVSLTSTRSRRSGQTSVSSSRGSSSSESTNRSGSSVNAESASTSKWSITPIKEITGRKLPSNGDVIAFYVYLRTVNANISAAQIVNSVYDEVVRFYKNTNIPTKERRLVEKKISQLYDKYLRTKSIKNRKRDMYQKEKQSLNEFMNDLDNLFDISILDAQIDNDEYKTFLENQRKPGRPGRNSVSFSAFVELQK